jgi:hypothetical protein
VGVKSLTAHRWRADLGPRLALDVKVSLTPTLYISLMIVHTKYTGLSENDFNIYA